MAIEITTCVNGWSVKDEEGLVSVYRDDSIEGLVELLRDVRDLLGGADSRHDEERVHVCVFPGDKHVSFGSAICPVCHRSASSTDS